MNIKKIIREEIDDMDWLRNIDPYSFVKNYYDSFSTKRKISRMSNDYAHLKSDKNNLKEILYTMGYEGVIDEPLMLKALTKYYKENIPLIKRFWSRFNYDDLQYVHNQIIDSLFENTDDLEWIIREEINFINETEMPNLLYHWISEKKANDITKEDILYGNFIHTLRGKKIKGNSFSRNKNLKINYSTIRLTVDKDKLKNNYKIIPLDAEIIHRGVDTSDDYKYQRYKDRNPKKTNVFGDQPIQKNFDEYRFDEEFVVGDIKNISRYITQIDFFKDEWYSDKIDNDKMVELIEYCKSQNIKTQIHN
jgi:hypothetical protein